MSGGTFDYKEWNIEEIEETIQSYIDKNGRKKTPKELKEESYRNEDWYEKYPEDLFFYKYPDDIIEEFKNGVKYLKLAFIYAKRIDYLIAGDDGEDSFRKRLKEELKKL